MLFWFLKCDFQKHPQFYSPVVMYLSYPISDVSSLYDMRKMCTENRCDTLKNEIGGALGQIFGRVIIVILWISGTEVGKASVTKRWSLSRKSRLWKCLGKAFWNEEKLESYVLPSRKRSMLENLVIATMR